MPTAIRKPSPLVGEDNHEMFTEILGLSEDEFEELRARGVI